MSAQPYLCLLCMIASPVKARACAFTKRGAFRRRNYACGTMLSLRAICKLRERDDLNAGSIGVVAVPEDDSADKARGWLVLSWYKERGATPGAIIVDDEGRRYALTHARATWILEGRS